MGGIIGTTKESNYLYNYSDWTTTITDECVRYIEKYSLGEMSIDEIVDLLKEDTRDINSVFEEPQIIKQTEYTDEELEERPRLEAVLHDIDNDDYIMQKEPRERRLAASLLGTCGFLFMSFMMYFSIDYPDLKKYKYDFAKMVKEKRKKYEEELEKYEQKLARIRDKKI